MDAHYIAEEPMIVVTTSFLTKGLTPEKHC